MYYHPGKLGSHLLIKGEQTELERFTKMDAYEHASRKEREQGARRSRTSM